MFTLLSSPSGTFSLTLMILYVVVDVVVDVVDVVVVVVVDVVDVVVHLEKERLGR